MVSEMEQGVVHHKVDLYLIFLVNGIPQLGSNDALHYYSGRVSSHKTALTSDSKLIDVECTSPLSDLEAKGTLFTTKDGMSIFDATDTSFDAVSEGSEELSLKWGKV